MPATADRSQFVRQQFRLSTAPTVTTIADGYGDLARNTDDAPVETIFSSLADVEHARGEVSAILTLDARLVTQRANLTPDLLNISFDGPTPTARAVDPDIGLDRTGLISAVTISLLSNSIEVETWG